MTDKQLITKAAEFMGWIEDSWETDCGCSPTAYVKERGGDAQAWKDKWNPLTSLDDAWMLVEKMQKYKERGHREEMAFNVLDKIAHAQIQEMFCVQAACAITLVVLEAAGKLEGEDGN